MSRRANTHLLILLLFAALAVPSLSRADSGGVGVGGGGATTPPSPGSVQAANVTATATGNGVTVSAPISALLSHRERFTGTASPARRGATVVIQRLDSRRGWITTATGKETRSGSFSAVWRTNRAGRFTFRAYVQPGNTHAARVASGAPTLHVTVYRLAIATLFGEGFYGSRTACGVVLRKNTLGVAHRTLPCGTPVSIEWRGRTIVVPVIDRGPYANHADWDLTWATGRVLGMTSTETIGAATLPRPR